MNRIVLYTILLLLIFPSCSKEKDESPPKITVSLPNNMQQINGIDTVRIAAEVSDNKSIKNIQVFLKNQNDVPVLSSISVSPNVDSYSLQEWFYFDDIHLPSGQYYFHFKVSDGENETDKYVDVLVNEEPKSREGIFLVDNDGINSTIYVLDNSLTSNYYGSFFGDFLGIEVNSYDQQLLHSSSITGKLTATDLVTNQESWSYLIPSSPPTPFYTGMYYSDNVLYTGQRNGIIHGYNSNGVDMFNAFANTNYYMESAHIHQDYFVTEQKIISGSNVQLVLYWKASGAMAQQVSVNEDIKGIFSRSSSELVLLTNDATNMGKVIFYYFTTGLTGTPFSVNIGKIEDCTEIGSGLYMVAEGGNLTLINTNNFSTLPYLNGVAATLLKYDALTNELFVIDGNTITVYDYPSKSIKNSYMHTSVVDGLAFWYNK